MSTKTTTQLQNGDEDSPPAPPSNYLSLTINKKQRWLSECTFGPNGWTGWDVFQTGETVTKAIWYSWSSQDLWKEYLQTKGPTGGLKTIALIDLIQAFNPLVLTFGNPVFVDHYHLFKGGQRGNQLSAFKSGSYPRVDDDELDPESGQTPEWPYAPFEQDFPTLTDAKKELPLFLLRAERTLWFLKGALKQANVGSKQFKDPLPFFGRNINLKDILGAAIKALDTFVRADIPAGVPPIPEVFKPAPSLSHVNFNPVPTIPWR